MRQLSVHSRKQPGQLASAIAPAKRVAIYARVSTTRQAEQDLSLPDQITQAEAYAANKGWEVANRFVEPGASATDDRRPEFQKMIDAAVGPDHPFDIVLVHSMSRFFRDQFQSELYSRKLKRAGVEVISITQQFTDDPAGQMVRKFIGFFDEYQSAENSKHTLRGMQENARQNFWNGSIAPFGYKIITVEQRGAKFKKRLEIDENESQVVRRIYDLALGKHGPVMGVKNIVSRLNKEGPIFRGKPFHISNVHRVLTSRTYIGEHIFNQRNAKTGQVKPQSEWIITNVPAIIDAKDFETVQLGLASRNPKQTAPRIVSGPILLTGLAKCGTCESGMTIRTGKSGRYRYYTCAGCAQKGKTLCEGRSVSMQALDGMVIEHLIDQLFTPDRLRIILEAYIENAVASDQDRVRYKQRRQSVPLNRLICVFYGGAKVYRSC